MAPEAQGQALPAQLAEATAALDKLDADLAGSGAAPIDQASRARAGCLAALTAARRAATPVSRAPGAGDALLADLSSAGKWSPARDDRGVVVTLRGVFAGSGLTPAGEARLRELAAVAAAHPAFPVAVVLHSDREPPAKEVPTWKARAEAVVQVLRSGQAPRVEPVLAGSRAPVVDPAGSERARNARVEIVFVTPETI
jgi:outer membrane protein OmpA-like peptidoglycan-associated protein